MRSCILIWIMAFPTTCVPYNLVFFFIKFNLKKDFGLKQVRNIPAESSMAISRAWSRANLSQSTDGSTTNTCMVATSRLWSDRTARKVWPIASFMEPTICTKSLATFVAQEWVNLPPIFLVRVYENHAELVLVAVRAHPRKGRSSLKRAVR